jgi:hypothetical protein
LGGTSSSSSSQDGFVRKHEHFLKPNAQALREKPLWDDRQSPQTIMRVLPAIDPTTNQFKTTRDERGDFTDWIGEFWAVSGWAATFDPAKKPAKKGADGEEPEIDERSGGISFFLDPYAKGWDGLKQLETTNPACILRAKLISACKNRCEQAGWSSLVMVDWPFLPKPKQIYTLQCFLYQRGDERKFTDVDRDGRYQAPLGARPDGKVVMMLLTRTGYEALHRVMTYGTEPHELDPIALDPGGFVHIWPYTKPREGQRQHKNNSYDVRVTPSLMVNGKEISASLVGQEQLVTSKVKPLDDLLEFYTELEQAHMLCDYFCTFKDAKEDKHRDLYPILLSALRHGFRDHRDWLTDEVRLQGTGAVSSSAPAATIPADDPFSGSNLGQRPQPAPASIQSPAPPSVVATGNVVSDLNAQREEAARSLAEARARAASRGVPARAS